MKSNNKNKKVIRLDFTGCKTAWEYHERIRVAFDFPEWYGKNWDAFWDLLRTDCDANKVEIVGECTLNKEFDNYIEMTHKILQEMVDKCKNDPEDHFEYEVMN